MAKKHMKILLILIIRVKVKLLSRMTFMAPWTAALLGSSIHGIFCAEWLSGCRCLLQKIFPNSGLNPCLSRSQSITACFTREMQSKTYNDIRSVVVEDHGRYRSQETAQDEGEPCIMWLYEPIYVIKVKVYTIKIHFYTLILKVK